MIPWEELNLGNKPILAKGSIVLYVTEALDQPNYTDAGDYMLEQMVTNNVITPLDNEHYRLCKITPARVRDMERVPRALRATYKLIRFKEQTFFTLSNRKLDVEAIISVHSALSKVVV